jgi:hypothetical protein
MSKFRFLKKNNSDKKLNFYYIEGGNLFSGLTDTLKAFTGIKKYRSMEELKFEFSLPEGHDIELDGDIYEPESIGRTISIKNCSTVRIITNGDI